MKDSIVMCVIIIGLVLILKLNVYGTIVCIHVVTIKRN